MVLLPQVSGVTRAALGPLKSVTFVSLGPAGEELYRTAFERGALEWSFSVNASGLIDNAKCSADGTATVAEGEAVVIVPRRAT